MEVDSDDAALRESLAAELRVLRERLGVTAIELSPRKESPLYVRKDLDGFPAPLKIACDGAIAPYVLTRHAWDPQAIKFAELLLGHGEPVTLVDVGANSGLFSRQLLGRLENIDRVFVYEPHPANFELLKFNLAAMGRIEFVNAALSAISGKYEFFLDPENSGNYSLNRAAMQGDFLSIVVEVKSARTESLRWLATSNAIFYKSDTQGFDELIATQFDRTFWDKVSGGIFELWRIEKPAHSATKMEELLESFPHKVFLDDPARALSTADVLAYLGGRDYRYENLAFWR